MAGSWRRDYQHRMEKVNVAEKLAVFRDHWHPRVVAEVNGLLFEPASTLNTGDVRDQRTVEHLAHI
jgi:hypothetical protein